MNKDFYSIHRQEETKTKATGFLHFLLRKANEWLAPGCRGSEWKSANTYEAKQVKTATGKADRHALRKSDG